MTDERSLVQAVARDDATAFRQLYERYADNLFHFLRQRTPDRETAEDLVQETFVRIWQARERLDPDRSFRAFTFRIARNLAVDVLRSKQVDGEELSGTEQATNAGPEQFITRDRLRDSLAALTEQQRAVFCLSRFDGLTYKEIGEVLQISVKTVEVHMGRALKSLRENLKDLVKFILFIPFW